MGYNEINEVLENGKKILQSNIKNEEVVVLYTYGNMSYIFYDNKQGIKVIDIYDKDDAINFFMKFIELFGGKK